MYTPTLQGVMHRIIQLVFLCCLTSSANASVLTWTLQDALLHDGGTLTGSFDYDADTNTFSNISITSSVVIGSPIFGTTYTGAAEPSSNSQNLFIYNDGSAPPLSVTEQILSLEFDAPMTNAGGTLIINTTSYELICYNQIFTDCATTSRFITSGTISTVPIGIIENVPLPVWAILVLALTILTILKRAKA